MLCVIGDFIDDHDIFLKTSRKSPECDAPVVVLEHKCHRSGGAGAVANMARVLGSTVEILGVSSKVNCRKFRHYVDGRQVYRLDDDHTEPISNEEADSIIAKIPGEVDIVLVADYGKGIVTDYLWSRLLRTTLQIIVDPARNRDILWYKGADAILPNRQESGAKNLKEAHKTCSRLGKYFAEAAIKMDSDGMVVTSDNGIVHLPSICSQVEDVCGAGDMVLAAVGTALERGAPWLRACMYANYLAGMKCKQHGATPVHETSLAEQLLGINS